MIFTTVSTNFHKKKTQCAIKGGQKIIATSSGKYVPFAFFINSALSINEHNEIKE